MRIEKFDVKEHPSLHDNYNSSAMMESFASSLPSWQIFNCADAAALLIDDFDRFVCRAEIFLFLNQYIVSSCGNSKTRRDFELPDNFHCYEGLCYRLLQVTTEKF